MKPVEYPDRRCREPFFEGHMSYSCDLIDFHYGPCASFSNSNSVKAREKWEDKNPDKVDKKSGGDIIL